MSRSSRSTGGLTGMLGHSSPALALSSFAMLALLAGGCARTQSASGPNGLTTTVQQQHDDDDEPSRPVPPDPYKSVRYKGGRDPVSGVAPKMSADGYSPEPAPRYRPVSTLRNEASVSATLPPPSSTTPAPSRRYASASPAGPTAGAKTVEVQTGDTLYSIATRNKVAVSALMQANNLTSANIKVGQKLALPQ